MCQSSRERTKKYQLKGNKKQLEFRFNDFMIDWSMMVVKK